MNARHLDVVLSIVQGKREIEAVRRQTAIVRALMDQLDHTGHPSVEVPWSQIAEELARLGRASFAAAAALSAVAAAPPANTGGPARPPTAADSDSVARLRCGGDSTRD
jgi:hypothetical protein